MLELKGNNAAHTNVTSERSSCEAVGGPHAGIEGDRKPEDRWKFEYRWDFLVC